MSGLISCLIAESPRDLYHGCVALGAALEIKEEGSDLHLNYRPKIPLLVLSNQSEMEGPSYYVNVARQRNPRNPVHWIVRRNGHVNVSSMELFNAAMAVEAAIEKSKGVDSFLTLEHL